MSVLFALIPTPWRWIVEGVAGLLAVAALVATLSWIVSTVEEDLHRINDYPNVVADRDKAIADKKATEADEIKRLDGIVARLDAIQKAQQALGVTVAANQAAIDASIADFEGKVRHATNLTPGSADDRLVRDSLCQLLKCP